MSSVPPNRERGQQARFDANGKPTFDWQLTGSSLLDTVKLTLPPMVSLPIIFVPGIMGSNLADLDGEPVWLLNSTRGQPIGLAWRWASKGPGARQQVLHPQRTNVYKDGNVPKKIAGSVSRRETYTERGWGEVGETSYHEFLLWLEDKMNGQGFNPAQWQDFFYTSISATPTPGAPRPEPKLYPGIPMVMNGLPVMAEEGHVTAPIMSDDLLKRAKCRFPVYACGYNWLASNEVAGARLKARIEKIIAENNRGAYKCHQVILVTHSMGGLVARFCAQLPGMQDKIAGVVHGVMPAVGAAVAYRRCKVGMRDEDFGAALVIGSSGQEVTAVFAQAPGALQLLPAHGYRPRWLSVSDSQGKNILNLPAADPYEEIYLVKDRWWGLVREEWLSPANGTPIDWNEFSKNVMRAKDFHNKISGRYHPHTFIYYGAGEGAQASFENIKWQMRKGLLPEQGKPPTERQATVYTHNMVRESGKNKIFVGGATEVQSTYGPFGGSVVTYDTSFWEIQCAMQDGRGDGTVPASSGMAPRRDGGSHIRQQFRLHGFSHEPSYKDPTAQRVTHYAITKIVALAQL
ncbi:pimeloyl-ACP methyl ester carboxylesterase [Duganella sp. 1224]|uniref:esterase/lipase family protein n=1 Tax=Duganella sp. 1224 TaxID=2587052 RepID=UPI0015CC6041|nr:alpha/beta hydrolase [Duganella sp. 1224]NYE59792.1 pimeloyl-ACP methyl ester carboxylesterase [Duganella sp. 1224]